MLVENKLKTSNSQIMSEDDLGSGQLLTNETNMLYRFCGGLLTFSFNERASQIQHDCICF